MTFPISDYIQPVLRQSYELRQSNCRGFKTLTSYHAQHEYSFYLAFVEYEATVADLESSVPSRRKSGCQLNSSQDIDTQPTGRLRLFQSGQLASRQVLRAFLSGKPCLNPNLFFKKQTNITKVSLCQSTSLLTLVPRSYYIARLGVPLTINTRFLLSCTISICWRKWAAGASSCSQSI